MDGHSERIASPYKYTERVMEGDSPEKTRESDVGISIACAKTIGDGSTFLISSYRASVGLDGLEWLDYDPV